MNKKHEVTWPIVRGLATGLRRRGKSWAALVSAQPDHVRTELSQIAVDAAFIGGRSQVRTEKRLSALRLLKFHIDVVAVPYLLQVATSDSESTLRLAALDSLTGYESNEIAPKLMEAFPAETPAVRRAILDVLLANEQRTELLMKALEDQTLSLSEIDPTRSARLTNHRVADIKDRANKLFAAAAADRAALLEKYASAARMDANAKSGRQVFEKNCATCHRVSNLGVNVGPDVGDNYARTPQALLLSILDPNRAVDNNYFGYTVITQDGRVLTGIITAETASSITLKQPEGKIEVVLRSDIDELKGSGLSLMPIGLEKNIDIEQMADLITFLKNWRYIDGNVPIEAGNLLSDDGPKTGCIAADAYGYNRRSDHLTGVIDMSIETEATYEDGVLKLSHALPLAEHERVKVVIETRTSISRQNYGIIGWTGDEETLRKIALEPEYGVQECP